MKGKEATRVTLEQIDIVHRMIAEVAARRSRWRCTADDVERAFKAGKIASLIGMEGGHSIDNSLGDAAHVLRARRALHDADAQRNTARGPIRRPTSRRTTA